jgi:hypothetical protein
MAVRTHVTTGVPTPIVSSAARPYQDGIAAGLVGAITITLWCLLVDAASGRLFYTASALGTALFDRSIALDSLEAMPVSMEMAMMFIWSRALAFMAIGGVAAHLLRRVDRNPHLGFGMLLATVIFGFGFTAAGMILAEPVLKALTLSTILIGNLFAATAMAVYFWARHPRMTIHP